MRRNKGLERNARFKEMAFRSRAAADYSGSCMSVMTLPLSVTA